MLSIPWFVYVALFGVLVSAFMVIRTTREERQVDESFIEQEGNVYIERMELERESRTKGIKKPEPM